MNEELAKQNKAYEKRKPYFRAYYRKHRKRMIRMAMEWQKKMKKGDKG